MLNPQIQHEYQPQVIKDEFSIARHTLGLAYPTRHSLHRYYREVTAIERAELEGRPFFIGDIRDAYRTVTMTHMEVARQPDLVDWDEADVIAHAYFSRWDKYSRHNGDPSSPTLAAVTLPAVTMEGYVEGAFVAGSLDRREVTAWYDDVFGYAAQVVNELHGRDCEDNRSQDDIDLLSCMHYDVCPHNELRAKLLHPLRKLGQGVIDLFDPDRANELTTIKLKVAILHDYTTLRDEESYVEKLYRNMGQSAI